MSQERTLVTQGQIDALNAIINEIAANLNTHVNDSLSAHALNGQFGTYFDSAGDTVGNVVLWFDFGNPPNITRLYVPAILTTLGPGRVSTGVNVTATTPSGSSVSPGIPLTERPLATVFIEDTTNSLTVYNDLLLAHTQGAMTDTGALQVHGGAAFTVADSFDQFGHRVGQYLIQIGINGTAFNLIAADGINGPPQPPRVQPFSQTYYQVDHGWRGGLGFLEIITGGGSSIINPPSGFADEYGIVVTPSVAPSGCTFRWDYFLANEFDGHPIPSDTFTNIPFVNHPGSPFQVYVNSFDGSIFFLSGFVGGDTTDYVKVRLTVTDTVASTTKAVNGSDLIVTFAVSNHTRCCWFCSQAEKSRFVTEEEWSMQGAIERVIFKFNPRIVAYYLKYGKELRQRMIAGGVKQKWFEDFIDRIVKLVRECRIEDAANYYVLQMYEMTRKYWPECSHPAIKYTEAKLAQ